MTQITIPDTPATVSYSITAASTGPFTVPFPFFTESDVKAKVVDGVGAITELVHSTDFTFDSLDTPVAQEGNGYEGGVISLNAATGVEGTITIYRDTTIDRTANFPTSGPFSVALLNDELNRLSAMMQEYNRDAVSIPAGSIGFTSAELPTPLALSILRWNATASSLENLVPDDLDALSANAAAIAASASEVAAAASAAAALSSESNVEADAVAAGASEIAAAASAVAAAASEVAAEAARDAAIVNSTMYADEATGRAAVLDTEYFKVIGSGNVACYEYVRVDASNSTLVAVYPSSDFVTETNDARGELENAFTDVLTVDSAVVTASTPGGRIQSPDPLLSMLVTPIFEGEDIDTPVVPTSVTVTGKNILNPDPILWESGQLDGSGNDSASGSRVRLADFYPIAPSTQYSHSGMSMWISLYDDAGVHQRQLTSTPFTTTADETQMRLYVVLTGATRIRSQQLQIEASAVVTTYEEYYSTTKTYDAIELFKYDTTVDTVIGNQHYDYIRKNTLSGTGTYGVWGVNSTPTDYHSFYMDAPILGDADNYASYPGTLVGRDAVNGDYPANTSTWNSNQKQIWGTSGGVGVLVRINAAKTLVDAEAGGTTLQKGQNYFNSNNVEVIYTRETRAASEPLPNVARGALILPKDGSIVVVATGGTSYDLNFQEVSLGGGGGGALTGRVDTLETNDTTQDSTLASLQTQIDDLIIGSGTSDAEVIAARTSAIGAIVDTTLKNRLDRTELTAGRINVQDYGAVGDGVTDDTVAILAARDAAEANDMALHFPRCADAYMIRNGILLTKSTIVTGVEDGPIKKIAAVSSDVNGSVGIGDTVIPVDDSTGFVVGYDVYVGKPASTSSYNGLRGTITAVDAGGPNEITVEAYNNSGGTGMIEAFADGEAVASQTFPMIYTDKVVSGSTAISPQVRGVHLDGNLQAGEPQAYTISLIHFDTGQTTANTTLGCILRNSPADAVSDQGSGYSVHAYNRMYANAVHGIHIGFTSSGSIVASNYANGNGADGMYYCYGNTNTRAYGNFFENMPIGFAEIGGQVDGDTILSGNITKNCDVDYEGGINVGPVYITDFLAIENNNNLYTADTSSAGVVIKGVASDCAGGIVVTRVSNMTFDVDFFGFTGGYCVNIANAAAVRCSNIVVLGQMHGATSGSVYVRSSDDCLIAPSISKPDGTVKDIIIATDGAQAACDSIHLGFGFRKNGITDAGTNTVDAMA